MRRNVNLELPDGRICMVAPYHMSMKGLESTVLCRDDEDYDVMVKYIAICARRKNVIVIIYAVVSNHAHVAVLSPGQEEADDFGQELKRVYSMWFTKKGVLKHVDAKAIPLENDYHVRNALAYIPRNAQDNGYAPHEYQWSGFGAMFSKAPVSGRQVSCMSTREWESIMHTGDNLKGVRWLLDEEGFLIPKSFCCYRYLEQVFNGDASFFYKTIGTVNPAEMNEQLVEGPRRKLNDSDLFLIASDTSRNWYSQEISSLPEGKRYRILSFLWRTRRTTLEQLARVLSLPRETVKSALKAITGR